MNVFALLFLVLGLGLIGWLTARARAARMARGLAAKRLHSLPSQHGWYVATWAVVPALIFILVWANVSPGLVTESVLSSPAAAQLPAFGFERETILNEARSLAEGSSQGAFYPVAEQLAPAYATALTRYNWIGTALALIIAFAFGALAFTKVKPDFRARTKFERAVMMLLLVASLIAILTTLGIFLSLIFESVRFFSIVPITDFLFGLNWSPQVIRADDPGANLGALPLFWGTFFIGAVIAMIIAIPFGLMSAIYLTQYAPRSFRAWMKPILEILAGVPTVVYGYFAALTVGPLIRDFAVMLGFQFASAESALSAGLVMGIMIIPFVSSMADDSIAAVPTAMRDGSLAMGATTSETIKRVLIPAALPGVVAGILLAVSRAIGETMIVVMAASGAANITLNPFDGATTVTKQIVDLLTGETAFDSPKTLAAFALGLTLFMITFVLNIVALRVVKNIAKLMSESLIPQLPTNPEEPARAAPTGWKTDVMQKRIRARYAKERRFRMWGLAAVVGSASFLAFLLVTMLWQGIGGFQRAEIALPIDFKAAALEVTPEQLRGKGADLALAGAGLNDVVADAAVAAFGPDGVDYISDNAWVAVRDELKDRPELLQGRASIDVPASSPIALAAKGDGNDPEVTKVAVRLRDEGTLKQGFNIDFLTGSDATDPTGVGIWGALKGSLLTMLVTLLIAFPIGVFSAIYLEEYAPRNRWTDLIEVSINNLAAVPSIIFGLLGLAVFLNFMQLPRSAPLVGGMTLALMIMPVIVIAGRNAIKAVPPSIRDAALGIGASRIQVVFHHVLPLALPGILTGTIIGMARALGETAPLLLIGMRAFIVTPPGGVFEPATVLPVQIFLWSDQVSRGFVEKTSAAIIVLLIFLLAMNAIAIYLRNRFETRW